MSNRRKKPSSKLNLILSFVFHSLLVLAVFYFAARQGVMGDKMKSLVATLEQPKPKEQPKPPKEEPKVETPKAIEQPKAVATTPPPAAPAPNTAPAVDAPPAVAPPTIDASFFADGAKTVVEVSDPKLIYKGAIERALRAKWERPDDIKDDEFAAEVELSIDPSGNVTSSRWVKGSGNARWDKTVKAAVSATRTVGSPPPAGFPSKFMARFDVEMMRTEEVLKVSSLN